jgi:hypothetical protein
MIRLFRYSFLLGLLVVSLTVQAQLRFAIAAGINIATARHRLNDDTPHYFGDSFYYNNVVKGNGGVTVQYSFTQKVGLASAIQYLGMGYATTKSHSFQFGCDYHYLNIPLSFRYEPDPKLSLHAGPYLSYLLDVSYNTVFEIKGRKKTDFGVQFGPDIMLSKKLGIGTRYFLGLMDIDHTEDGTRHQKRYNRALQIFTFYRFAK